MICGRAHFNGLTIKVLQRSSKIGGQLRSDFLTQKRFAVFGAEDHVEVILGQGLWHMKLPSPVSYLPVYLAPSELPLLFIPEPRAARWPLAPACPGLDYYGLSGLTITLSVKHDLAGTKEENLAILPRATCMSLLQSSPSP